MRLEFIIILGALALSLEHNGIDPDSFLTEEQMKYMETVLRDYTLKERVLLAKGVYQTMIKEVEWK